MDHAGVAKGYGAVRTGERRQRQPSESRRDDDRCLNETGVTKRFNPFEDYRCETKAKGLEIHGISLALAAA
jgi:hypothetical protein